MKYNPRIKSLRFLKNKGWRLFAHDLYLCPGHEFPHIEDGVMLHCINGTTAIVGKDYIDGDMRFGMLAYGVIVL